MTTSVPRWLSATLTSAALIAAVTIVIALLEPRVPALGLGALYLLAVVPIALMYGFAVAAAVSVASLVMFSYFFLPPRYSFDPGTSERWSVLAALLVSSLVVAQLAARTQREARRSTGLADEQAALRRVATLVARGVPAPEVFAAVAREVGLLLDADATHMACYEQDGTATGVAAWSPAGDHVPVGTRMKLEGESVAALVFRTGKPSRIRDYRHASGPGAALGRELGLHSSVGAPITVDQRLWGVMIASSKDDAWLPAATESRIAAFTELLATAIANAESRAGLGRLADEQAALRRVATLVARGAQPEELFAAVTTELGQLLPVTSAAMGRYDPDGMFTTVAAWTTTVAAFPVGLRSIPGGKNVMTLVLETGRPARINDFADASGPVGVAAREAGYRSAVGTPIIVEGHLWGVMTAASTAEEPLPADIEARLASFTELVATAIANTESRAALSQLAEEQAALRRVATLVARGVPPGEVFAATAAEIRQLLGSDFATLGRYESDRTITTLAHDDGTSSDGGTSLVGVRTPVEGESATGVVFRTGSAARVSFEGDDSSGPVAELARKHGVKASVGVPIVVEGRLWGVIVVSTKMAPLPTDTERRLSDFNELAATAIANAESRSELAASRARIVAASDETRRRIERDLHDGTQQRLVSLGLNLRLAESNVPPDLDEPRRAIGEVAAELDGVIDELREISRGIHPAILSEGGLGPALRTLARRSAIPVGLGHVVDHRLPEPIEVAAYYVVSEALTNATKHADASHVDVEAALRDGSLRLSIRDDGVGGADPAGGSGLVGVRDRVEALGGSIDLSSPPGHGTQLVVQLPLELGLTAAIAASLLRQPRTVG